MRVAVNRTVTALRYAQKHSLPKKDLVESFPGADELTCAFVEPLSSRGDLAAAPVEHVRLALDRFATASPRFVRKLKVLKLHFHDSHAAQIVELLAELLPRFTSLEALHVHVSASVAFVFRGSGQTPLERRSSMQQQLADICASSGFLAPSSWPTSQCLTSLNLDCGLPDIQPSVLLSAALQTVSLVELGLTFDDALAPEACASVQRLSSLTNLTQLTVDGHLEEAAPAGLFQAVLTAAAQATSLQRLEITGTSDTIDDDSVGYLTLGELPHLTRLLLDGPGLRVDLASLSAATALKELNLTESTGVGALTSLFSLTRLTNLDGPVFVEPQEEDVGAAAVPVPAAWREGLRTLGWQCSREQDIWPRMVPQLTSLTRLSLNEVCVAPAFCRMLSKLPHLAELILSNSSAADAIPAAPSEELRSLLPALASVSVDFSSAATLYTLALWTRVRNEGVSLDATLYNGDDPQWCTVVVKVWSAGWLRSTLGKEIFRLAFVLIDDCDVLALNAASAGLPCPVSHYMGVLLGERVSLGALQQLQVSARLHVRDELPEEVQEQADRWTAPLALTPARFLALVRPYMDELNIDNGSLVDDEAFQEMASRAIALTYLQVRNAAKMGDTALWKLCGSCPQLNELLLSNPAKVTAAGLLPLLTTHGAMLKVVLTPAPGAAGPTGQLPFAGLVARLSDLYPGVYDAWVAVHVAPAVGATRATHALHFTRQQL